MVTRKAADSYDRDLRRAREAKARFRDELMGVPGVHGIGIGYKRVDGRRTDQLALVLHVYRKRPKAELGPGDLLPDRLRFLSRSEGVEVTVPIDVREVEPPVPEVDCSTCDINFGQRVRPVPGGYSVGLATQPGGTLGGWVWDSINDQIVLISNHHVLGGTAGDRVIQPSIGDLGSSPADDLGVVVRAGTFDASIARPDDSDDIDAHIRCSADAVFEITDAFVGMEVEKAGQTTGLTCGLVDLIDYDSGHYGSHDDVWIDGDGADFSNSGDSGSLYVERTHPEGRTWKRIVGIHWGGSGNDGVGHPIRAVMSDLSLTTICAGLFSALLEALQGVEAEREPEAQRASVPRRAASRVGLARDLERRVLGHATGSKVAELLHEHRATVVRVLLTGDGRRAAQALLRPVLANAVTTDDVLEHRIDEADLANAERLLKVARRVEPEIGSIAEFAQPLMKIGLGRTIGELLEIDDKPKQGARRARPEKS